jgi:hypothetical protein
MRIFRTLVLLAGAAVLMPAPPEDATGPDAAAAGVGIEAPGLLGSATMAVADAATFCARQPAVCETAGHLAHRLEAKAKYGVRLIYEWAAESRGDPPVSPFGDRAGFADPISTGSTVAADVRRKGAGRSSLTLADLIPPWRGPVRSPKNG